MNVYVSIPLFSALLYFALIVFVLNSTLNNVKRAFIWYLTITMIWSLSSFILHGNFFPERTLLVHEGLVAVGAMVPIAYYHFIAIFTNKVSLPIFFASFLIIAAITIVDFGGFIIHSSVVVDSIVNFETSPVYYIIFLLFLTFLGLCVYNLVWRYRHYTDPLERNRITYLLSGLAVNALFVVTLLFDITAKYPLDHVGNIANAVIISYAILKYQLLNIKFIARRGLAYFILLLPMVTIYAVLVVIGQRLLPHLSMVTIVLFAAGLAIIFVLVFRTLRNGAQELIDRFFYRDTYKHRQLLLNLGNKLGGVINLNQLADEILPALCNALKVSRAELLLRDISKGNFSSQFIYPELKGDESPVVLVGDNPIITWLGRQNRPLELRELINIPEFKGLWQSEKERILASKLGLMCPIKNQGVLTGIFALGQKESGIYSQEDLEMTMSVAGQVGLIIENAQQHSQALLKANSDGLSGLYNHRHFHERLEQEIARSSRFGTVFSVIMLDIDLFKVYNDNYGHLAGDEIIRYIGEYIRNSIRSIDIAARYGGEEFAIILPETRLVDAHVVAERIRKTIEAKTISRSMPVTISLGVANWPVDGVMKEELLNRADQALYLAKQNGRNRTCLSTDVPDMEAEPAGNREVEVNPKALSMIYALAATVDAKDHYTYGHSRKVSEYAAAIAEAAKMPREKVAVVRAAGLLHDIGKIGIPDSVLNKKDPLTSEEWEPIKAHPQLGVAILRHILDLTDCLPAILHHHEHFDGSGYPNGLKGENIPAEARVLAVADAYEAMTSPRPYRKQMTTDEAIVELRRYAGIQFDPEYVEIFCKVLEVTPLWRQ